jgi:regulator of sigma E protease
LEICVSTGFLSPIATYVAPLILVLGLLVFVHELGHFLVAKLLGVRVLRFSMGFGPRLAGVTVGGTEYRISALPLGGYVKMAGDETGEVTGQPGEFLTSPWWVRALIAVAGPVANVITAFVLLWVTLVIGLPQPDNEPLVQRAEAGGIADSLGIASGDRIVAVGDSTVTSWQGFLHLLFDESDGPAKTWPQTVRFNGTRGVRSVRLTEPMAERLADAIQPGYPPVIGNVVVNLPAYRAGFETGDSIVAIAGRRVHTYQDVADVIHGSLGRPLTIEFVRRGKPLHVTVTPISQEAAGGPRSGMIGIEPMPSKMQYVRPVPVLKAAPAAARWIVLLTGQIVEGLWRIVLHAREARDSLTGPIGIAQSAASFARQGMGVLLVFAAFIGVSLALFNLLPIPVLDGGHIAFAAYEGIARRPLSVRAQLLLQRAGLAFIGSLFVFVIMNDTIHLVERHRAVHADQSGSPPPVSTPTR